MGLIFNIFLSVLLIYTAYYVAKDSDVNDYIEE